MYTLEPTQAKDESFSGGRFGSKRNHDDGNVAAHVHPDATAAPLNDEDATSLKGILEEHKRETGSARAEALLARWGEEKTRFLKITAKA